MARDGPQAGAPLHFELYTEEDEDNYMRWKWISKKEAHRVLRGIDATLLQRSGLHDALWMDWSRPEEGTEFVKEFVLNWDDDRKQSTVDGQVIPVNVDVIRNVFGLAEGRTAPRSARHYEDLSDWVHERSKSHKTWFANDVFFPEWRPIIQLINVVLLGKQKPLEVTGAFIYILKNKVGPANLNEDLDWASYFSEKIREEIRACRKQMRAAGKRKFRPTCIGIVILHILRVLGVVDDDQLVHSDSEEGLPEPQQSESPDRHTQSSSPGVIRGDSSSSPASGRSGSPAHAVASSSEHSLPDIGLRAKARSQQTLMLYGRVRMALMALRLPSVSAPAKFIHKLNHMQRELKIKDQDGHAFSQLDVHILEHKEILDKDFEALQAGTHVGKEVEMCELHEKTFWQWMVSVVVSRESQGCSDQEIPTHPERLKVLSEFCTTSIIPVVEQLKHYAVAQENLVRVPRDPKSMEIQVDSQMLNLEQLSVPVMVKQEVPTFLPKVLFPLHEVKFTLESAPTGGLPPTADSDAESIVERLKLIATALVQVHAKIRSRNRICLEEAMSKYTTQDYVLHNFWPEDSFIHR
ncbi:hypothetical protein R1sor_003342 [Riccia sorocarpa]|uniref:Uncharacterized protein n=1 Tax=Riccia sorocarpa TaxID=122646 RepID=A0ABD3H1A9_9MARC